MSKPSMWNRLNLPWPYLALLLAANLTLLLPNSHPLRVGGAVLLIGFLPGLSWATCFLVNSTLFLRWAIAGALSTTITVLLTLLLHYLPGPIQSWQLLVALNTMALLPLLIIRSGDHPWWPTPKDGQNLNPVLLLILIIALFLRVTSLNYSEFQGDEALAMISAAEALEGHEDALFLRAKGPGEVLLPMALWRLSGTMSEAIARLPFTLAALWAIMIIYLIGQTVGGQRVGWLAAAFFAFNGFMVAFGRIVQYQALVIWMSALALLMAIHGQQTRQSRFAALGGLFLGTGLLAHYDAILVLPAIGWLYVATMIANLRARPLRDNQGADNALHGGQPSRARSRWVSTTKSFMILLLTCLATALPFYLPHFLDPQANRTSAYVGQRIGNELRNNLPDFFHFNTFYSSSYYMMITGLLVLGLLSWLLWQTGWPYRIVSILAVMGVAIVLIEPSILSRFMGLPDLAIIPFAALFLGVFSVLPLASVRQTLLAWLAVPFLGYNFVVALGLTHIYTIVPAWSLLAGWAWYHFFDSPDHTLIPARPAWLSNGLLSAGLLVATIFLWNAFVRHDVEYWQDYPNGNLSFYWDPYDDPPKAGFFGFAHRTGWKVIGQKIVSGELRGDYGSNEEPDVTTWYTRGAPRACDPKPEFYFLADDLIDPVATPDELIEAHYQKIGSVTLPNQKQLRIMQQIPPTGLLGDLDDVVSAQTFDRTATPAAFARSARGSQPAQVNFGNLIQLIGYDLDPRRAQPGGRLPVTLYWQVLAPIQTSYQVFTHLESEAGPIAQSDGVPVCWTYPTDIWRPGQIIADQHAISISADTRPDDYPLEIGLYLPDTFQRLDVIDVAGNPAGTSVTLDIVRVKDANLQLGSN